jgi:ubiquinone/menaquinone biosynthesis C-methylase UbiE
MTVNAYVFDDNQAAEEERLLAQSTLIDPMTRRIFAEAGLTPGMRVLDLGSGAGNVAMLAAELVGPEGGVVGVDRDPIAVERARRLVAARGLTNVEFRQGDVQTLEGVESGFDAVVGRLILMYLNDPAAALRAAAARLRPGGLACMHESDVTYYWAFPETPLWRQIREWFLDTLAKAGAERSMALSLFATFRAAGLPDPQARLESLVAGGPDAPTWAIANLLSATVPVMERLGIATSEEVDAATLPNRLLADLAANDGAMISPPMVGAWSTVR